MDGGDRVEPAVPPRMPGVAAGRLDGGRCDGGGRGRHSTGAGRRARSGPWRTSGRGPKVMVADVCRLNFMAFAVHFPWVGSRLTVTECSDGRAERHPSDGPLCPPATGPGGSSGPSDRLRHDPFGTVSQLEELAEIAVLANVHAVGAAREEVEAFRGDGGAGRGDGRPAVHRHPAAGPAGGDDVGPAVAVEVLGGEADAGRGRSSRRRRSWRVGVCLPDAARSRPDRANTRGPPPGPPPTIRSALPSPSMSPAAR